MQRKEAGGPKPSPTQAKKDRNKASGSENQSPPDDLALISAGANNLFSLKEEASALIDQRKSTLTQFGQRLSAIQALIQKEKEQAAEAPTKETGL